MRARLSVRSRLRNQSEGGESQRELTVGLERLGLHQSDPEPAERTEHLPTPCSDAIRAVAGCDVDEVPDGEQEIEDEG